MKWLKKILRIIAIILPSLLFFYSPGVGALSYSVDKIPITIPYGYNNAYTLLEPFYVEWTSETGITYTHPDAFYFKGRAGSGASDDMCRYNAGYNAKTSSSSSLSYDFGYYLPGLSYSDPSDYVRCNTLDSMAFTNFPLYVFGRPNYADWDGYRYQYDGFYVTDVKTDNGLQDRINLDMSYLFKDNRLPRSFEEFHIPLGVSYKNIIVNTPIGVQGEFHIGSQSETVSDPSFAGSYYVKLVGYLSDSDWNVGNTTTQTFTCDVNYEEDSEYHEYLYHISFTCSGVSQYTYDSDYPIGLTLYMSNNGSPLWTYETSDFTFDYFNVYFNNDLTPGGSWSGTVQGGEKQNAPGSAVNPAYTGSFSSENPDYFSSLVNMFTFTFTNPFQPIYNMFTSGDECASIPIIAGMLNAPDDEYCPWFDASTRNIVTPVVSLASIMLIFGFIVRWLGSDSGNFIEDRLGQSFGKGDTYIKGGK